MDVRTGDKVQWHDWDDEASTGVVVEVLSAPERAVIRPDSGNVIVTIRPSASLKVLDSPQARREAKARQIVAAGLVSPNGQDGQYYVISQSGNGRYLVRVARVGEPLCTCWDFRKRGGKCKHILAAELYEEVNDD